MGGAVRLYRNLQQGASSLNIKKLLSVKENHISQVKEFRVFLCMGKCKSLGLLKSFLSYASQLSGASAHPGEWLMAPDSRHCSSWAQKFTFGGPESLMAMTVMFIDVTGNTPFHSNLLRFKLLIMILPEFGHRSVSKVLEHFLLT